MDNGFKIFKSSKNNQDLLVYNMENISEFCFLNRYL